MKQIGISKSTRATTTQACMQHVAPAFVTPASIGYRLTSTVTHMLSHQTQGLCAYTAACYAHRRDACCCWAGVKAFSSSVTLEHRAYRLENSFCMCAFAQASSYHPCISLEAVAWMIQTGRHNCTLCHNSLSLYIACCACSCDVCLNTTGAKSVL
jgi:hypothetical protein